MKRIEQGWWVRILAGGGLGLLTVVVLHGPLFLGSYSVPPGCKTLIDACGMAGAVVVSMVLFFTLGATVGLATLPFADNGPALLCRSLAHLGATALEVSLILWLCICIENIRVWALCMAVLVVLYVVVWLGRWIGWYVEVMQLRTLLGLAPGPSPLKWRETAPYLPFVLLLCGVLPVIFCWFDRTFVVDVPVLSGLLMPWLMLPVGGFCSGLSLGKRQGVCLLYPMACFLCCLFPVVLLDGALFSGLMAAIPALAGNVLGWMYRRAVPKGRA